MLTNGRVELEMTDARLNCVYDATIDCHLQAAVQIHASISDPPTLHAVTLFFLDFRSGYGLNRMDEARDDRPNVLI